MLIYCPKCETGCSDSADVCPKCGHNLGGNPDRQPTSIQETLSRMNVKIVAIIVTIVSGALFGAAGYVLGTRSCPDGECTVEDLRSQIFAVYSGTTNQLQNPKKRFSSTTTWKRSTPMI